MDISTGHINLFDLYGFAASHPKLVSGKDRDMADYGALVRSVVGQVPDDKPGWYLWGRFNSIGYWETIYFGKAGKKKTSSLRARIREELLDERAAIWASVYGIEPIQRQHESLYANGDQRQYRKMNAHFIAWISAMPLEETEIEIEEKVLIALYRPTMNIRRAEYPPHTQHTDAILRAIDSEIFGMTTPSVRAAARRSANAAAASGE